MRPSKRKRRRAKTSSQPNGVVDGDGCKEEEAENQTILECDFSLLSLEAAEKSMDDLLGNGSYPSTSTSSSSYFDSNTEDPSTSSSSSSYDRFLESELVQVPNRGKGFGGTKPKRVIASTGIVSSVIGKDYVRCSPAGHGQDRRYSYANAKEDAQLDVEEMEQFLCSILGDECQLSLAIVRDVLCYCGYDVEKALDALLELSGSSHGQFKDGAFDNYNQSCVPDSRGVDHTIEECQLPNWMSDSNLHLSEGEFQQILKSSGHDCRKYSEVLVSSPKCSSSGSEIKETCLPQKVLESLFNVPKNSEQDPNSMNWKNIVKKMESFGPGFSVRADNESERQKKELVAAKGTEYQVFRKDATEHYDAMKSYYQKAATAFSRGDRGYAAYLSDQGRVHNKIAREADEKASQDIFEARNKAVQNVVTIDLHGQHVKQAVRLLKVHLLLFTTYISSVQYLRVITGCGAGAHGVGQGKLKQTVIDIVKKVSMEWGEENRGTLMIKVDGQRDLSFWESEEEFFDS